MIEFLLFGKILNYAIIIFLIVAGILIISKNVDFDIGMVLFICCFVILLFSFIFPSYIKTIKNPEIVVFNELHDRGAYQVNDYAIIITDSILLNKIRNSENWKPNLVIYKNWWKGNLNQEIVMEKIK